MDTLANGLTTIINNEMRNKRECIISPASKLLGRVLRIMQLNGYVGEKVEVLGALRPTVETGGMIMRVEKITLLEPEEEEPAEDVEEPKKEEKEVKEEKEEKVEEEEVVVETGEASSASSSGVI